MIIIESVACTVDDAMRAERAGASRIELVAAISEGGLTPSTGAVLECKARGKAPVVAMLRPRGGGFFYSDGEFASMQRDVPVLTEAGADGLVTGMLLPSGELDVDRLQLLVSANPSAEWVCHRAFDAVTDPFVAIDQLVDLGFCRILTSGQSATALAGSLQLLRLREYAGGRIEIMPGGGVRAVNARQILAASGAGCLHLGPFVPLVDPRTGVSHLVLDDAEVAAVVDAVGSFTIMRAGT